MAMDFSRSAPTSGQSLRSNLFGTTAGANQEAPAQRAKAEFWLNIGYLVAVINEQGQTEDRFVSLPMGLPLDTMEKLPTNRGSDTYRQFQSARNDFLTDLVEQAKGSLQPGQEHIIELGDGSIAIQIRRVAEEKEAVSSENNPFRRQIRFGTQDGE